VALTIAGSDSGGGAGIQADLKAFARCGVHGTCAITAITAQNTLGVSAVHPVPVEIILAQVRAVADDIGVDAVKIGMLGTAEVALGVARALDELPHRTPVVLDPVMVAESGAQLLEEDARRALLEQVLPRAGVVTPNVPEARVLVGAAAEPDAPADLDALTDEALVRAVGALGSGAVVLTGGHRATAVGGDRERAVDLFLQGDGEIVEIPGERHLGGGAHGSGCTHSAALAAHLALGRTPLQAARAARAVAGEAVRHGLRDVGAGAGPVDVLGIAALRDRGQPSDHEPEGSRGDSPGHTRRAGPERGGAPGAGSSAR